MSAEEKFIMVDNDFVEKGLTLEEAYILGRVKSLSDENLIYRETNESIANAMGKSVRAVKNWINNLVKKGYLRKEYNGRCRMLYSTDKEDYLRNLNRKEHIERPLDGMNLDEKVTYLKTVIDQRKFSQQSINDLSSEEKKRLIKEKLDRMKPRNEEDIY